MQLNTMCSHWEGLAKLVEVTHAEDRSGSHSGCRKNVVEGTPCEAGGLTEKDDVEAYLVTFERIFMQVYEVDKA